MFRHSFYLTTIVSPLAFIEEIYSNKAIFKRKDFLFEATKAKNIAH